jgi:hypothetical protein
MFKNSFLFSCLIFLSISTYAQMNEISHEAEWGISIGSGHYFGDMNRSRVNSPKPVAGIFVRKQFGSYVALRAHMHLARLGYADKYNTTPFERQRNLSFKTNLAEFALQGDFNFFKYLPGSRNYRFTPYLTFGLGVFSYDPTATIPVLSSSVEIRDLNKRKLEGKNYQFSTFDFSVGISYPIGMGIKYNFYRNFNIGFEVAYRFTNTDYLDDVSTTYRGVGYFDPSDGESIFLQDRSLTFPLLGIAGKQRGFSEQKDQFIFAELTLSISFNSYKCADIR